MATALDMDERWTWGEIGIYQQTNYAPLLRLYERADMSAAHPDARFRLITLRLGLGPGHVDEILRAFGSKPQALMFLEEIAELQHKKGDINLT